MAAFLPHLSTSSRYGYRGGVAFANKENNTNVEVSAQYAEVASPMLQRARRYHLLVVCDVVFHAAGGVGTGVIEAAKDANRKHYRR